jgi:hypothetical protein
MKGTSKKLLVFVVAAVMAMSFALVGCSSPAPAPAPSASASASGAAPATPAAPVIEANWLGDWTSQYEIAAPAYAMAAQVENTGLKLTINADGSWKITENGTEKYSGTATPFETTYYQGENGTAETDLKTTVNGAEVYMRIVVANGLPKMIWNCGTGAQGGGAGATGDGTLPKYVFA